MHPSYVLYLSLPSSAVLSLWRQQTLQGFSDIPSLGWRGLNPHDTHNILGLLSLYPSARLSNHQSEAEENSTNLTAATTHTFTGPTRENTLLPWLGWECGYMCVSLISDSLCHTLSHAQKKNCIFCSMRTSLVNKNRFWTWSSWKK